LAPLRKGEAELEAKQGDLSKDDFISEEFQILKEILLES
jgi:hypothetical protein